MRLLVDEWRWPVVPVAYSQWSGGCSCAEPLCAAPGAQSANDTCWSRATAEAREIGGWWQERPLAPIVIPIGWHFDVLEVPDRGGREALCRLELMGYLPAPAILHPEGRLSLLVAASSPGSTDIVDPDLSWPAAAAAAAAAPGPGVGQLGGRLSGSGPGAGQIAAAQADAGSADAAPAAASQAGRAPFAAGRPGAALFGPAQFGARAFGPAVQFGRTELGAAPPAEPPAGAGQRSRGRPVSGWPGAEQVGADRAGAGPSKRPPSGSARWGTGPDTWSLRPGPLGWQRSAADRQGGDPPGAGRPQPEGVGRSGAGRDRTGPPAAGEEIAPRHAAPDAAVWIGGDAAPDIVVRRSGMLVAPLLGPTPPGGSRWLLPPAPVRHPLPRAEDVLGLILAVCREEAATRPAVSRRVAAFWPGAAAGRAAGAARRPPA